MLMYRKNRIIIAIEKKQHKDSMISTNFSFPFFASEIIEENIAKNIYMIYGHEIPRKMLLEGTLLSMRISLNSLIEINIRRIEHADIMLEIQEIRNFLI